MPPIYYRGRNKSPRRENYSLGEHPTVEELLSPEVMRRAAQIKREIRRREAPLMQKLLDNDRLTAEDYMVRINARDW